PADHRGGGARPVPRHGAIPQQRNGPPGHPHGDLGIPGTHAADASGRPVFRRCARRVRSCSLPPRCSMKQFITALYAATLLIVALPAQAQDGNAALYGPVPPADAAFVRVLNLTGELAEVAVTGKSRTQSVGAGRLGNFIFMEPGPRKISVGSRHFEDTLGAHAALTLVFDGQSLKPILETFSENPKKALVSFYNLTEQPLALRTADGRYTLIDNVAAQQAGSRSVNEIKVGLAAY